MNWRLNRIQYPVCNLGPGKRIALWVQGCDKGCPGCVSPTLWNYSGGRDIDINNLLEWIEDRAVQFDGVTISGGEPFDQYAALIEFAKGIKRNTDWDILVYTGYVLEELQDHHPEREFLELINYLVDGPYIADQHDNANWRGSRNQRFFRIEQGLARESSWDFKTDRWSVAQNKEGRLFLTGVPRQGDLIELEQRLQSIGLDKENSRWQT